MSALSIAVRYKPVRIGFCVKDGDMDELRRAMRNCHALWGGRYNPIIPVGEGGAADQLVRLFRVDCLLGDAANEAVSAFVKARRSIANPTFSTTAYAGDAEHRHALYLDILHPMRRLYREHYNAGGARAFSLEIHSWDADDPLRDVMLAVLGGVPDAAEAGVDYGKLLLEDLEATAVAIAQSDGLPGRDRNKLSVATFSSLFLKEHHSTRPSRSGAGIFIGSAASFTDLVTFWNLRATGAELVYFDPQHLTRMTVARDTWIAQVNASSEGARRKEMPTYWYNHTTTIDRTTVPKGWVMHALDEHFWSGLNRSAPSMYFAEGRSLGSLDETAIGAPRVTFQLPDKGLDEERPSYRQNLVAVVESGAGLYGNELWTFSTPDIPELNEYYGRSCYFEWNRARAEPSGLGIILTANHTVLSLTALSVSELFAKVFGAFGIQAEPSTPGLIARRLIQQMGGVQDCRVFKIAGVRRLIKDHGPDQTFRGGAATQAIFGKGTASPLDSYDLYIEQRPP